MHDDDDNRLLQNFQRGDEAAYSTLVGRFQERIFRLAWQMTGDATLAEEATAQVLVKLWTRAGQWSGEAGARTWIFRMAVRTTLDVQRSQHRWWRRWASGSMAAIDVQADPAFMAQNAEQHQLETDRLQAALDRLAPSDRALVHLYYYEDRNLGEIEGILGVGRDALKARLARARKRLRRVWDADLPTE